MFCRERLTGDTHDSAESQVDPMSPKHAATSTDTPADTDTTDTSADPSAKELRNFSTNGLTANATTMVAMHTL